MTVRKPRAGDATARRSELVIFAPYRPAKSGIADYAAELMPYHLAEFDVTLVIADDAPIPVDPGPRILLASEFRRHRKSFESVPKLYHVGNNPQHCYMLDFLGSDPGIVVLHDYNLCYLHEMATLRWGDQERHRTAMESEYGALGRDLIAWQMQNGYRENFVSSELPLNGIVLERATGIITHSRQVQYRAAARVPTKPVWYVPHHLSPRAGDYRALSKQAARSQLALPADEIIVTALGFVTRAKQIALTLEALSSLVSQVPRFRFVLAGERRLSEYDVDADIDKSDLKGLVTCTDYLDEDLFFKHLVAADIIVNLRYPSGGEMSGTLTRALGLGVPTLVLDNGPMGELPDNVVKKVQWTEERLRNLTEALRDLMTDDSARRGLGRRAAEYARQEHDIAKTSAMYAQIIRETETCRSGRASPIIQHFAEPRTMALKLREMKEEGRDALENCDARICWTVPGVPLGDGPEYSALIVSGKPVPTSALLSGVFEWNPESIACIALDEFLRTPAREHGGSPLFPGRFTTALAVVPADLEEHLAALLLRRLNAAICRGGSLCMEVWTGVSAVEAGSEPLAREILAQRLRDAGFSSIREWSAQDGYIIDLVADPGIDSGSRRSACVSARKASDYAVWRYSDALGGLPMRWGGRIDSGRAL